MAKVRTEYLPFGKPDFSDREIEAVAKVLRSGWIGQGLESEAFEQELASYVDADHVIGVNSCTSALFLAMTALGIGPGDEVVVPSLTWCSTANAVLYTGAIPVFCDVDLQTMSVSPEHISHAVTPKTRAVAVVHYGGLAVDVRAVRAALPGNVSIIEDAAHALGALYPDGTKVGSSGNPVCFSFYANKNLAMGDGGAIAVNDAAMAEKLRLLSHQGLSVDAWKRFSNPMAALTPTLESLGYKMNMIDLLASIGRVQLARQNEFQQTRQRVAECYQKEFLAHETGIFLQSGITDAGHAKHLFVVRLPVGRIRMSRDMFLLELRARNVGASIHYAPLHMMPFYQEHARGPLPNTEQLMREIITLPIGASVSEEDACYVLEHMKDLLRMNGLGGELDG